MSLPSVLADLPNPVDIIDDVITAPAGWAWDKVTEGITKWVLGAVEYFVSGVVDFLASSVRPDVEAAWFSGAGSPYATVRNMAGLLLLAFLFLGIIQGLLAGDVSAMMRRVWLDLPASILGMVAITVVVAKLLELTDALSATVLGQADEQAVHFLSGFGVAVTGVTQGFAAVIVGLVAVLAAFLVWVELMVRSVLVYVIVALSPLSFAAMVWPATRGVLRRTIELLLAVIVSKLVICITLSVGIAALAGAGSAGGENAGFVDVAGASMGTLFVGAAILVMAAFAPFLVLKLIPWAETALVAQGMSRSPMRAAQSGMGTVYYVNSLSRLAGGGQGGGSHGGGPPHIHGGGWTVNAPVGGSSPTGAVTPGASGRGGAGLATSAGTGVATAGATVALEGARTAASKAKATAEQSTEGAADLRGSSLADGPEPPSSPTRRPPSRQPDLSRRMDAPEEGGDS